MGAVVKPVVTLLASAMVFSTAGLVWAQTLTPAEEAAASQRELTASEIEEKAKACSFGGQKKGTVDLSEALTVDVFELAALRVLLLFHVSIVDGEIQIDRYPDLPNGGISALHICEMVNIEPVVLTEGNPFTVTMRLPERLDLFRDYPNSAPLIAERNQLRETSARRYALLRPKNGDEAVDLIKIARASDKVDRGASFVSLTTGILVPLKPE